MAEMWDLYDENRRPTGRQVRRGEEIPPGLYHLVATAWVVNSRGEFLLTQRHPRKDWPLYWECSGGGVQAGETSLAAIVRELEEELGLACQPEELRLLASVTRPEFSDIMDCYYILRDVSVEGLCLQPTEVVAAKWVTPDGLLAMYHAGEVLPLPTMLNILELYPPQKGLDPDVT